MSHVFKSKMADQESVVENFFIDLDINEEIPIELDGILEKNDFESFEVEVPDDLNLHMLDDKTLEILDGSCS